MQGTLAAQQVEISPLEAEITKDMALRYKIELKMNACAVAAASASGKSRAEITIHSHGHDSLTPWRWEKAPVQAPRFSVSIYAADAFTIRSILPVMDELEDLLAQWHLVNDRIRRMEQVTA